MKKMEGRTKPKPKRRTKHKVFGRKKEGEEKISYVYRKVGRKRYKIPVDANGIVPLSAIAQRFQEVGNISDTEELSEMVLPTECTPDEILEWWIDPSSCDIEGVDTDDPEIYDVSSVAPEYREAQRRISVIADTDEQIRIRKILSDSFTPEELMIMAQNGSFVIKSIKDGGDATGCYWRRQDGVEVPLIEVEDGCTPDGIVHEAVHHARAVDRTRHGKLRTTYPIDSTGKLDSMKFARMGKRRRDEILEDEERLTTCETVVRTRPDRVQSGYYDDVPKTNPRRAYEQDMRTLRNLDEDTPDREIPILKGKEAIDAVTRGYEYTNIARAQILKRDVSKR